MGVTHLGQAHWVKINLVLVGVFFLFVSFCSVVKNGITIIESYFNYFIFSFSLSAYWFYVLFCVISYYSYNFLSCLFCIYFKFLRFLCKVCYFQCISNLYHIFIFHNLLTYIPVTSLKNYLYSNLNLLSLRCWFFVCLFVLDITSFQTLKYKEFQKYCSGFFPFLLLMMIWKNPHLSG